MATEEQFGQERGVKGLERNMIAKREEEIREAKRKAEEERRLEEQRKIEAQRLKDEKEKQRLNKIRKQE